jgi:iron complex outermembrane recepter protein
LFNDVFITEWDQDTQSAALFTHNEWQFTEQWQLVFGGRYTWEEKEFFSNTFDTLPFGGTSGITGRTTTVANSRDVRISDNAFTGSVSLEYSPTDKLLSYFKFSKGFKGGGFSGLLSGRQEQLNPYEQEELYAYELGIKANLFNRTLGINSAFFYYDYRDMQVFAIPLDALIPVSRLTNAEKATVLGMDASIIWQPIDELEINTNIGLLDHQIKDSRFNDKDLPNAPKLSFSNIIRYEYLLSNNLTLTPMLMTSYQEETFKSVENTPLIQSDGYWLLNTRVSIQQGEQWELAAWANNLTDEVYVIDSFDQSGQGIYIFNYGMPRTYGMSLSYRFD